MNFDNETQITEKHLVLTEITKFVLTDTTKNNNCQNSEENFKAADDIVKTTRGEFIATCARSMDNLPGLRSKKNKLEKVNKTSKNLQPKQ